jgi:hypothetical protein
MECPTGTDFKPNLSFDGTSITPTAFYGYFRCDSGGLVEEPGKCLLSPPVPTGSLSIYLGFNEARLPLGATSGDSTGDCLHILSVSFDFSKVGPVVEGATLTLDAAAILSGAVSANLSVVDYGPASEPDWHNCRSKVIAYSVQAAVVHVVQASPSGYKFTWDLSLNRATGSDGTGFAQGSTVPDAIDFSNAVQSCSVQEQTAC